MLFWKYGNSDLAKEFAGDAPGDEKTDAPAKPGQPAPEELADDLEKMGPTFIKFGQLLSSRADLLPEPYMRALARLQDSEKALLPEILPTVESLVERVRTLASALHSLDTDASPDALVRLPTRSAEAGALPVDAPERSRRLELLERQLKTLTDLAERRTTLAEQMEHALLVLETMKLDLMRLRSSGVESRLADQGPVTQEMRELARDVQRVAEAVDETRKEM